MDKINAKYVFLDVVNYTSKDIESQSFVVKTLQKVVKDAVGKFDKLDDWFIENTFYLPTGDGMCIVIENIEEPEDIHIQLALKILQLVDQHNKAQKEQPDDQFHLRVGVNENKDIVYKDINGRRNYAGRGINYAQRVMSASDPDKIFVGSIVYEKLADTRKYKHHFKEHKIELKGGHSITVFEYVE